MPLSHIGAEADSRASFRHAFVLSFLKVVACGDLLNMSEVHTTIVMEATIPHVKKTRERGTARCQGKQRLVKDIENKGHVCIYTLQCEQCRQVVKVTNAHPDDVRVKVDPRRRGAGPYALNVSNVLATLISTTTHRSYVLSQTLRHEAALNLNAFHSQLKSICDATAIFADIILSRFRSTMRQRSFRTVVSFDGGWSQRGWNAFAHCFVMFCSYTGKLIYYKPLRKSTYRNDKLLHEGTILDRSSKAMEAVALDLALRQLHKEETLAFVSGFCLDQDSSASNIIRAYTKETGRLLAFRLYYDPGHYNKSHVKKLMAIFGTGSSFKGVAARMGRTLMRLIKRAEVEGNNIEQMKFIFISRMKDFREHYTIGPCMPTCFCMDESWQDDETELKHRLPIGRRRSIGCDRRLGEGPRALAWPAPRYKKRSKLRRRATSCVMRFTEEGMRSMTDEQKERIGRRKGKIFFDPLHKRHWHRWQLAFAVTENLLKNLADFIHGYHTTMVEGAHRVRTRFAPKDIRYVITWEGRCALMALQSHLGTRFVGHLETHLGLKAGALDVIRRDNICQRDIKAAARKSTHEHKARSLQLELVTRRRREAATVASKKRGLTYKDKDNSDSTNAAPALAHIGKRAQSMTAPVKVPKKNQWVMPQRKNADKYQRYTQDELREHYSTMVVAEKAGSVVRAAQRLYQCDECKHVRASPFPAGKHKCCAQVSGGKRKRTAAEHDDEALEEMLDDDEDSISLSDSASEEMSSDDARDDDDDLESLAQSSDNEEMSAHESDDDTPNIKCILESTSIAEILKGRPGFNVLSCEEAMSRRNKKPKALVVTKWTRPLCEDNEDATFWAVGWVTNCIGSDDIEDTPTHDILFYDNELKRGACSICSFRLTSDRYAFDDSAEAGKWCMLSNK